MAESAIRRLLLPIIGLIGIAIVGGIILSSILAGWIIKPILGLIGVADRISKADLDTPVNVDAADEISELARSLERMRLSLKAAMARLNRDNCLTGGFLCELWVSVLKGLIPLRPLRSLR